MKWMRTFILLSTILVLWLIDWHLLRRPNDIKNTQTESYKENNIQKIFIKRNGEMIILEKDICRTWQLTQPFHWPVNPFAIKKFFQALILEKTLPSDVTITLEKNNQTKITLKNTGEEDENFRETTLSQFLKQGIAFWCTRKVCPLKSLEISQIDFMFHMTQQKFSLIKKENRWEFFVPFAVEADSINMQKFLEYIVNLETIPVRNDDLQSESERIKCEITLTLRDDQQRSFNLNLKKKIFDSIAQSNVYLAEIPNNNAHFFVPLNEILEHPWQSLCNQSLFSEIHSVSLDYQQKKLFLSRNESNQWGVFKFSNSSASLQLLEKFDEKSLLLYLSLMRPLDVVEKSTLNLEWMDDKLILEVNKILKFEIKLSKDATYLFPMDKNYAIKIEDNLMKKLIEILEKA
ncbi:MAG: hypothetical protein LBS71_00540 [Puniceicoccales bacterium]|jgi:hypothetical protein|nr:hypothetical protein [Puniceicoccales bacterium]